MLGAIGSFLAEGAIEIAIGALISGIGIFGLTYKLWAKVTKELGDVLWKIYKAVQPGSPGGSQITKEEITGIFKEAEEVYPAITKAIAAHKKV